MKTHRGSLLTDHEVLSPQVRLYRERSQKRMRRKREGEKNRHQPRLEVQPLLGWRASTSFSLLPCRKHKHCAFLTQSSPFQIFLFWFWGPYLLTALVIGKICSQTTWVWIQPVPFINFRKGILNLCLHFFKGDTKVRKQSLLHKA